MSASHPGSQAPTRITLALMRLAMQACSPEESTPGNIVAISLLCLSGHPAHRSHSCSACKRGVDMLAALVWADLLTHDGILQPPRCAPSLHAGVVVCELALRMQTGFQGVIYALAGALRLIQAYTKIDCALPSDEPTAHGMITMRSQAR